jgi:transposase
MMIDPQTGKLRKSWAFVMTLAWSRHQYVEFVWDQKVATFLRCHRNAFEFMGGVPERVRIDNLKTAILKAVFDDPQVQQSYRECAEHYGFLIAPCRVATPEHKGKVEQGGVHYVKRNFLGGREVTILTRLTGTYWSGVKRPLGCAFTAQPRRNPWSGSNKSKEKSWTRCRKAPTI